MTPLVADATERYHELLAGPCDPKTWWSRHRDEVLRHWHDEAPIASWVLRPFLIDEATYAQTMASVGLVMRGFAIATDRLAADEALRRAIGIPAYMEPLLELDRATGKPSTLGRLDGHMAADGTLKLIELNSEPQSAPFQHELEASFAKLPIAGELARSFRVRTIDTYALMEPALRARTGGRWPTIAIIDKALWRSHRRASIFRPLMACSAHGCPVLYVDPEELDYRNGKLTANGVPVDLVAFPSWELLINARKRLVKVLKAIGDGAAGVYAGLSRGLLASYKTVFELLSSAAYQELFPADVNAALARHIPWTRGLRERKTDRAGEEVDLVPFVAANRERLVIKPAGGGGGGNIHVGRDLTDTAWAAAIQTGLAQHWIVQELAPADRQMFPIADADGNITHHELNCEFTPYVWNGECADGVLCRVVAGSVISDLGDRAIGVHNGVETATWIIDRR